MCKQTSIIFIGRKMGNKELEITNKPGLSDAILLSNHPKSLTKRPSYQSIDINSDSNLSIHICDENIKFIYQNQVLQVFAGDKKLSEQDVFNLCNNFAFKEGNKVTILGMYPKRITTPKMSKKVRVLVQSKELGED